MICVSESFEIMIRTKSVYSTIDHERDGLRVLVTRFRGRGLPKNRYDVWMANLGPSEKLLRDFLSGQHSWADFTRRYRRELFEMGSIDKKNVTIKNHGQKFTLRLLQGLGKSMTVTLMCHCGEDQQQCHRHILKRVLRAKNLPVH